MKHAPTIVLLLLVGCGEPETVTQPESPVQWGMNAETKLDIAADELPTTDIGSATPKTPITIYSSSLPDGVPARDWDTDPINLILNCKVIGVINGDTVDVLAGGETIRIRLNGIDTPERGQPFGNNAKQKLSYLIGGRVVSIQSYGRDKYDRTIGDIRCDSNLINLALVEAGLAWHYVKYAQDRTDLAAAEKLARDEKRGLWAGGHKPIPPWTWRRMSKEEKDQYR